MESLQSPEVEKFLLKPEIHQQWESVYRSVENEDFFERAFDYITRNLRPPTNSLFLDVGCGSCAHSIRLAKRGFQVEAIDLSENILETAKANVRANELNDKISIRRANILSLPFKDNSLNYILCWGVLMHVPNLEPAIAELIRVLKPGGTFILSENNLYSFQALVRLSLKRWFGLGKARVKRTPQGVEYWFTSPRGTLLTRQTDIGWLIRTLKSSRVQVTRRISGQFTDLYTTVSYRPLRNLIHGFNNFWFRYIKSPYLAVGNILILRKEI